MYKKNSRAGVLKELALIWYIYTAQKNIFLAFSSKRLAK